MKIIKPKMVKMGKAITSEMPKKVKPKPFAAKVAKAVKASKKLAK